MKYAVSSEYNRQHYLDLSEIITLLNDIEEEQFVVVQRDSSDKDEAQDYMQTTINTGDDNLFWLEARHYYSDNIDDFSHYRQKLNDIEPIIQAFTEFFNEQESYLKWEDVTEEFKNH